MAMKEEGVSEQDAIAKIFLVDSRGLVTHVSQQTTWQYTY